MDLYELPFKILFMGGLVTCIRLFIFNTKIENCFRIYIIALDKL